MSDNSGSSSSSESEESDHEPLLTSDQSRAAIAARTVRPVAAAAGSDAPYPAAIRRSERISAAPRGPVRRVDTSDSMLPSTCSAEAVESHLQLVTNQYIRSMLLELFTQVTSQQSNYQFITKKLLGMLPMLAPGSGGAAPPQVDAPTLRIISILLYRCTIMQSRDFSTAEWRDQSDVIDLSETIVRTLVASLRLAATFDDVDCQAISLLAASVAAWSMVVESEQTHVLLFQHGALEALRLAWEAIDSRAQLMLMLDVNAAAAAAPAAAAASAAAAATPAGVRNATSPLVPLSDALFVLLFAFPGLEGNSREKLACVQSFLPTPVSASWLRTLVAFLTSSGVTHLLSRGPVAARDETSPHLLVSDALSTLSKLLDAYRKHQVSYELLSAAELGQLATCILGALRTQDVTAEAHFSAALDDLFIDKQTNSMKLITYSSHLLTQGPAAALAHMAGVFSASAVLQALRDPTRHWLKQQDDRQKKKRKRGAAESEDPQAPARRLAPHHQNWLLSALACVQSAVTLTLLGAPRPALAELLALHDATEIATWLQLAEAAVIVLQHAGTGVTRKVEVALALRFLLAIPIQAQRLSAEDGARLQTVRESCMARTAEALKQQPLDQLQCFQQVVLSVQEWANERGTLVAADPGMGARIAGAAAAAAVPAASTVRHAVPSSASVSLPPAASDDELDEVINLEDRISNAASHSACRQALVRRYAQLLQRSRLAMHDDADTVAVMEDDADGQPVIPGWLYVDSDTLQQHRPDGFWHRFEVGFSTAPRRRLRQFLSHGLDNRWLMTFRVTDVLRANDAALTAVQANGARIIPGRVKWIVWPDHHFRTRTHGDATDAVAMEADSEGGDEHKYPASAAAAAAAIPPRVMDVAGMRDIIRLAVREWQPAGYTVEDAAGPAQDLRLRSHRKG